MHTLTYLFGIVICCMTQGLLAQRYNSYELHILKSRMALVQRDTEDQSISHCQLFGTRMMLEELMEMRDLVFYDYEKEESLTYADFKSLLTECEEIEYKQIEETRKQVQIEKKLPKHIVMEKRYSKNGMQREKRAVGSAVFDILRGIYPGTKWCGLGNIADGDELGQLSSVDACCRQHDKCPNKINAFATDEDTGLFNFALYTKSHCDCDGIFKDCLKDVKNEDANNVGDIFFDILDLECYKLDYPVECIDRAWWGWCYKEKPNKSKAKEWYFTGELTY